MASNFMNSVQVNKPPRSVFDLTHDVKLTGNMGNLIPTLAMECVPGDMFNINAQSLLRFQPMIAPAMHRVQVYHHYWFVPNRIIWPNWENWITNKKINGSPTLPLHPFITYCNI